MLKLDIPPLLAPGDGSPVNPYVDMQQIRDRVPHLYAAIAQINASLKAVDTVLRAQRRLETDFVLYGPNGEVIAYINASETSISSRLIIDGTKVLGPQLSRPTGPSGFPISGSAGATYGATEQGLINTLITQINLLKPFVDAILNVMINHGLTN